MALACGATPCRLLIASRRTDLLLLPNNEINNSLSNKLLLRTSKGPSYNSYINACITRTNKIRPIQELVATSRSLTRKYKYFFNKNCSQFWWRVAHKGRSGRLSRWHSFRTAWAVCVHCFRSTANCDRGNLWLMMQRQTFCACLMYDEGVSIV